MIGTRVKLGRVKDEKAAKDGFKRTSKTNGKTYDIEKIVVLEVLELPAEGKTATSGKSGAFNVAKEAETVIKAVLDGQGVKTKKRLGTMILSRLADNPNRDAIYQWLFDDKNLALLDEQDVINYDKAAGTVQLLSEVAAGVGA